MQKRTQYLSNHICQNCGTRFKSARFHARTCSDKCRKQLSRAGRKDEMPKNTSQIKEQLITLQQLEALVIEYVYEQRSS